MRWESALCNETERWRHPGSDLCPVPGREGTQSALGMQADGIGYPRPRQKALGAYRAKEAQRTNITYLTACGGSILLTKAMNAIERRQQKTRKAE